MNELSLYILDIAQNSIKANSKNLIISIIEDINTNKLTIIFEDDGIGMSKETLDLVENPFYTTRKTRKVGLGIPLMKELCETCNGKFNITSKEHVGTKVTCEFEANNIDVPPLGNISETIYILLINEDNVDIVYKYIYINKIGINQEFEISSKELKETLDGVSMKEYEIMSWIKMYINDSMKTIKDEEKV